VDGDASTNVSAVLYGCYFSKVSPDTSGRLTYQKNKLVHSKLVGEEVRSIYMDVT
jgi:hypothetical protein